MLRNIFGIYEKFGGVLHHSKPLTYLQHANQTALIAEKESDDSNIILGAFFHEIGDLLKLKKQLEPGNTPETRLPTTSGSDFLRLYHLPYPICDLVEGYPNLERFTASINNTYYAKLSTEMKERINNNGGLMTQEEMIRFINNPLKERFYSLNNWSNLASSQPKTILNDTDDTILLEKFYNMASKTKNY